MNRAEVIKVASHKAGMPAKQIDQALAALIDTVGMALACGEEVNIRTFGKFKPQHRRATVRPNPKTGEPVTHQAITTVGFKPAINLKQRLNQ